MFRKTAERVMASLLCVVLPLGVVAAEKPQIQQSSAASPVNKVFKVIPPGELLKRPSLESDHPLAQALELALDRYGYIRDNVHDYTCMLVKRERINEELRGYEFIAVKFRSERAGQVGARAGKVATPFSVYMKYLSPKSMKGREILYVKGQNDGDMLARKGGRRASYLDFWLDPDGELALRENRYPITEFGIENLVARLIEIAQQDMQYGECKVNIVNNAKLDDRSCTAIEVRHPVPRDYFQFHLARILIDNQLQLPVYYVAYTWPQKPGDRPRLEEEYTFRNLRVNVGLTDEDFSRNHPDYGFRKTDGRQP